MLTMLTMRGPEFLALYALLALVAYVLVGLIITRRERELAGPDPRTLRDPYAIAYLRAGARELLQVVCLNLTKRGQLRVAGSALEATGSAAPPGGPPIEAAVLQACARPLTPAALARSALVQARIDDYREELTRQHLIAGPEVRHIRLAPVLLAIAALVALAAAKIDVALSTGHNNIAFLVILAIVTVIILLARLGRRRTALGKQALAQLSELFRDLRRQSSGVASGAATEAALLAAVFGVYALSGAERKAWSQIWSPPGGSGGDGGGGGDSGGGGCGGGGGGGCGGCGGS
jgi:uncharacterized protein (TIGR04222 family)